MPKQNRWCIVIPFDSESKAVYAAKYLKDYVCLDKFIMEMKLEGTEEKVDYAYIDSLIKGRSSK